MLGTWSTGPYAGTHSRSTSAVNDPGAPAHLDRPTSLREQTWTAWCTGSRAYCLLRGTRMDEGSLPNDV